MKFGLYLGKVVKLVDLETGEIVAAGAEPVRNYLKAFEDNYILQIL